MSAQVAELEEDKRDLEMKLQSVADLQAFNGKYVNLEECVFVFCFFVCFFTSLFSFKSIGYP